jgi:hypothetical protein
LSSGHYIVIAAAAAAATIISFKASLTDLAAQLLFLAHYMELTY